MDVFLSLMCVASSIAFFVFAVYMAVITTKAQRAGKKQREEDKKNGIERFSAIAHVTGLAAVENSSCTAEVNPSNIVITCAGKEYTLPLRRIAYVDYKADIDETIYQKSSFVKGVAGAAMFGVSGAVIGSAPKTKTKREEKGYAIIGYMASNGKEENIVLRDEIANFNVCEKIVKTLKAHTRTTIKKVQL